MSVTAGVAAGIILGGSVLGLLDPADPVVATMAEIGVIVLLFAIGLETELAWSPDRAAIEQSLTGLRVGARTTDVVPALTAAYDFLAASSGSRPHARPRRRIIVLLSDNAAHAFRNLAAAGLPGLPGFDPEVSLLGLAWDGFQENAAVVDVRPGGPGKPAACARAADCGQTPSLLARCGLFGRPRNGWSLSVWLEDRRAQERGLDLPSGLGEPIPLRLPAQRDAVWGRLELRADGLAADDAFFYSLRVQPKPRVLYLYGSPDALEAGRGGFFLRKLLGEGARGEGLPYPFDAADIGRLDRLRLEDYGAVILDDFRRVPPEAVALGGADLGARTGRRRAGDGQVQPGQDSRGVLRRAPRRRGGEPVCER